MTIGNGITSIQDYTFNECFSLKEVTIPNSVTTIGFSAFFECGLTSLTIGHGVTSIGDDAFADCFALTTLTIPSNVTSIGTEAFFGCDSLTTANIGEGVASIGAGVFEVCNLLTAINVESTNSTYRSVAGVLFDKNLDTLVQYPGGKTGNYTVPASVTTLGDSSFAYCANVKSVTLPRGLSAIADYAFAYSGLTGIRIPDNVTSVGDYAFNNCFSLQSLSLGNRLTSIGDYAFSACPIKALTIPNSVTTIGEAAFAGGQFARVTIPNQVTSLGAYAFSSCDLLTTVGLGYGLTSIPEYLFYECGNLHTVFIPSSVTTIDGYAFSSCGLASVNIPSSVSSIGADAFSYCGNLGRAYFEGNAPQMGYQVFEYDAGNFEVCYADSATGFSTPTWTLPNNNGNYAAVPFESVTTTNGGDTLTAYNGPAGAVTIEPVNGIPVVAIGPLAFFDTSITSVTIPASVTSISSEAFEGCNNLTSITVAANNPNYASTSDGVLLTADLTTLVAYPGGKTGSYTIPSTVTTVGDESFQGASNLTDVIIPDSVTTIGSVSFEGCTGLSSVVIPGSVSSIGGGAFIACSDLTSAVFEGNAPLMDEEVFFFVNNDFVVSYYAGATGFSTPFWTDSAGETYPSIELN